MALLLCWLLGSFAGACLTGHPVVFLKHAVVIALTSVDRTALTRQWVTEYWPSTGDFGMVLAVAVVLAWRSSQWGWNSEMVLNPAFMLAGLGWLLGFTVGRFWWDWGVPAAVVWMTGQFHQSMEKSFGERPRARVGFSCLVAAGLFLSTTGDIGGRWTESLSTEFLMPANKEMAQWLPGEGGILYSSSQNVFYETFFKNPRASWRYLLGFDATFMPPEDLAIYREIQRQHGTPQSFMPWVKKMRPPDRLVIRTTAGREPPLPELEWLYAVKDTWIGRRRAQPGPGRP